MEEKILLVEDEEKLARMVELELRYEGYQVHKSFDGRSGLERALSGEYDLVILDELTIALYYRLLTVDEVLDALRARHPSVEVVVTGRYAPQELVDEADLVTEMREVKHYYTQGVLSREGIDR